jgi:hypothetical protein
MYCPRNLPQVLNLREVLALSSSCIGFIRSWNPEENHHRDFSVAVSRLTRNDREGQSFAYSGESASTTTPVTRRGRPMCRPDFSLRGADLCVGPIFHCERIFREFKTRGMRRDAACCVSTKKLDHEWLV